MATAALTVETATPEMATAVGATGARKAAAAEAQAASLGQVEPRRQEEAGVEALLRLPDTLHQSAAGVRFTEVLAVLGGAGQRMPRRGQIASTCRALRHLEVQSLPRPHVPQSESNNMAQNGPRAASERLAGPSERVGDARNAQRAGKWTVGAVGAAGCLSTGATRAGRQLSKVITPLTQCDARTRTRAARGAHACASIATTVVGTSAAGGGCNKVWLQHGVLMMRKPSRGSTRRPGGASDWCKEVVAQARPLRRAAGGERRCRIAAAGGDTAQRTRAAEVKRRDLRTSQVFDGNGKEGRARSGCDAAGPILPGGGAASARRPRRLRGGSGCNGGGETSPARRRLCM